MHIEDKGVAKLRHVTVNALVLKVIKYYLLNEALIMAESLCQKLESGR